MRFAQSAKLDKAGIFKISFITSLNIRSYKMKKYVSFRHEKTTYKGAVNQANHDFRLHVPKYVDHERLDDNITLYASEEINSFSSWQKLHEDQKTRVKELTGRKAQEGAQFFSKGIMTFSNTMSEDYANNPELFERCALDYIEKLNQELGLQCVYAQIHLDETTPHIHLLFDNIDKTTGKGIQRQITKKKLIKSQDLMGECFAPMGYERGEPVSDTNAKHLRVSELHALQEIEAAVKSDIKLQENLIQAYMDKNPAVMFLMRMLENRGHIDVKSEKGREALNEVVRAVGSGGNGTQGQGQNLSPSMR